MKAEPQPEHEEQKKALASLDEAREAIKSLSPADCVKLMVMARFYARTRLGSTGEAKDLLQEALTKTLERTRKWNKNVPLLKHLDGVMKSDSGHIAEKREKQGTLPEGSREPPAPATDLEERLDARDRLRAKLDLFAGDEIALEVLHLKGEGRTASEIQRALGIEKTQYESITKRIQRRLCQAPR